MDDNPRKILKLILISSLVFSGLLGCAQKSIGPFSLEEREKLSSVFVVPMVLAEDAFKKPEIVNRELSTSVVPIAIGGAIVPIITGEMSNPHASPEAKEYWEKNSQYYEIVQSNIPDFVDSVDLRFREILNSNSFFATRLASESENTFSLKITEYGFVRRGEESGEILMKFYIGVTLDLRNRAGRRFIYGPIYGESSFIHSMKTFSEDANLIGESVAQAIDQVVEYFDGWLRFKTQPL